jgi:hypothetical protein
MAPCFFELHRRYLLPVDAATAGLIGAGIGGAVSLATAVVTALANARTSAHQFAREAEAKKLESLQSVLDDAGLALENEHWAIRAAVAARPESTSPISAKDEGDENWRAACARMEAAKADVSRQGTKLAIRLGVPSDCVDAYNSAQFRYRGLVDDASSSGSGTPRNVELTRRLDALGTDHTYLNAAAQLQRPKAVNPRAHGTTARGVSRASSPE